MSLSFEGLEHFYFSKLVDRGEIQSGFTIVAHSSHLEVAEAQQMQKKASLGSYGNTGLNRLVSATSLVQYDLAQYIITHVYPAKYQDRGHPHPEYHCVVVPADV